MSSVDIIITIIVILIIITIIVIINMVYLPWTHFKVDSGGENKVSIFNLRFSSKLDKSTLSR